MMPYGVLYWIRLGNVATGCAYQTPGASSVDLPHGILVVGASKLSSWASGDCGELCLHLDVVEVRSVHVAGDLCWRSVRPLQVFLIVCGISMML